MHDSDVRPAVGMVGLGAMGAPMARHLLNSGYDVWCVDLDEQRVSALVGEGARAASSNVELAKRCAVVLLLVPSDDDILEVGRHVIDAVAPGGIIVVCSSVRPETCHRLAGLAEGRSTAIVDAALTGGVRAAEAGTVRLLAGGEVKDIQRVRPVLSAFSSTVDHLGPLGSGQVGKTVNNLLHWNQIAGIVEALELGERLGVSAPRMRKALIEGSTDSRTLHDLEHMRLTWHAKDLANALWLAEEAHEDLPVARRVRDVMPAITVERIAALLQAEAPTAVND